MYKRKYSLKTRYNFRTVFRYGLSFEGEFLLFKYIKARIKEGEDKTPKFAVVTSNKFTKIKVIQNSVRRLIASSIQRKIKDFPKGFYYIIIPKKNILDTNGKIIADAKKIDIEIDTFLSKMVVD